MKIKRLLRGSVQPPQRVESEGRVHPTRARVRLGVGMAPHAITVNDLWMLMPLSVGVGGRIVNPRAPVLKIIDGFAAVEPRLFQHEGSRGRAVGDIAKAIGLLTLPTVPMSLANRGIAEVVVNLTIRSNGEVSNSVYIRFCRYLETEGRLAYED